MYKPTEYEIQKILEGQAAIDAGHEVSFDEVKAEINKIIRVAKLKAKKGGIHAQEIRRPMVYTS